MDTPLIDPDEAVRRLLGAAPALRRETVDVRCALGRTLAAPIVSPMALPPFDRAAMDGYAVRFEDPWPPLAVAGVARAGEPRLSLPPGAAIRIFTGAPLPHGADTVIEQEACQVEEADRLRIRIRGFPGRNVMRRGHEMAPGTRVAAAGTRLTPYHLALVAAVGFGAVAVRKTPAVAILETGDELTEPGRPLAADHIYAANGALIGALVRAWGGAVRIAARVPDTRSAVTDALLGAARRADLVVVTGGVSVGDFDFVPAALHAVGRRLFWGVSMHPGRATAAGLVEGTPVVALSGNPGAAVVA